MGDLLNFGVSLPGGYGWYPPAEPVVGSSFLWRATLGGRADFAARLVSYLDVSWCRLGGSARELLAELLEILHARDVARDVVHVPGYTCYSVAAAVARSGLRIAAYDVDPVTLEPDLDALRQSMGPWSLAVVGQHLFGIPADMAGLAALCGEHGAYCIEDAAQALGGRDGDRMLGTLGDYGLFSFGRGKPLPLGYGGALVGKSEPVDIPRPVKTPRGSLLRAWATWLLSSPWAYGMLEALPLGLGETIFEPGFPRGGFPSSLDRLGACALDGLQTLNRHRAMVAEVYRERLGSGCAVGREQVCAVYPRYPIRARCGEPGRELLRLGVRRMYPRALVGEPAIASYLVEDQEDTPGASALADTLLTLPTHSRLGRPQAGMTADQVRAWLDQAGGGH